MIAIMRFVPYHERLVFFVVTVSFLACGQTVPTFAVSVALQDEVEVSPEATPQIKLIKPAAGAPGDDLTLVIEGGNFSKGVYVSFSSPAVHAVSTRRVNATRLEARIQIGKKTQPGPLTLYVSNTASAAVEGTFSISGGPAPAPGTVDIKPSDTGVPEVTALDPPRVSRGSQATLKLTGNNFAPGTKISFSNPAIRVLESEASKSTELTARIQVASDAATGSTSLFVIAPGDRETEVSFEVTDARPAAAPATTTAVEKPAPAPASKSSGASSERFDVYNLGEAGNILQNPSRAKGALKFEGGKLRYEENSTEVFAVTPAEIKEVEMNVLLGISTGTFHVILNSGKTYNFVATSLRPADSQSILDSLRRALR